MPRKERAIFAWHAGGMTARKLTDRELSELGRNWFAEVREQSALEDSPSMVAAVGRGLWSAGFDKVLRKGLDAALSGDGSAVADEPFDCDD
jgi:hypothetical protein